MVLTRQQFETEGNGQKEIVSHTDISEVKLLNSEKKKLLYLIHTTRF